MLLILCVGAKTPGIPPSKVQWFSLLTAAVMACNCPRSRFSLCLEMFRLMKWLSGGEKKTAQNNARSLGQKFTHAPGKMRQSYKAKTV